MAKQEQVKKKPKTKNGITYVDKMCTTHEFRVAFPSLDEAVSYKGQKERFNIIMLFDEDTNLKVSAVKTPKPGKPYASLTKAIYNAKVEMWGAKENWPDNIAPVIQNGDDKMNWEGFPGHLFAKAWSYRQPKIFGTKRNPDGSGFQEIQPDAIYPGCYCRATVVAFAYDDPKPGVGLMLTAIQKIRDGESFIGGSDGSEFDGFENNSDDDDEDEDDRPKNKSRREEDDEDEAPRKKKAKYQEDDDDERPRSKKKLRRDDDEDDSALWS